MNITSVDALTVSAQAWRNGSGQTRELLVWPTPDAWQLRISRADIDHDGPFSAFPQVERWFALLHGQGVVLIFAQGERTVRPGDDALRFDGAAAPGCRLIDGPTQDLNLMLRQGDGVLCRCLAGQAWEAPFTMRGLYTTAAGRWHGAGPGRDIGAHSLLWVDAAPPGPWTFYPHAGVPASTAWWLGFTPRA
jgi:environmental stress-induced protein Ves